MLCEMPPELLNVIIAHLDFPDRFRLRATCKAMKDAVENSDINIKQGFVRIDSDLHKMKIDFGRLMLKGRVNDFTNYLFHLRKMYKRLIVDRIVIDLTVIEDGTLDIVKNLNECCMFKKLKYTVRVALFNDRVRKFLLGLKTVHIEISLIDTSVDRALLFAFTLPYSDSDQEWKLDDESLVELIRRGHTMSYGPVKEGVSRSERLLIAGREDRQSLHVKVSQRIMNRFLDILGIDLSSEFYEQQRVVEGVRIVPTRCKPKYRRYYPKETLQYKRAQIVVSPLLQSNHIAIYNYEIY